MGQTTPIYFMCNNINLQSVKTVLNLIQWFISALSGLNPYKRINSGKKRRALS